MLKGERQPVPQESEYTPEQIERIKFLLVQFETGIDFDNNEEQAKNCIGLHGTSLDAFLPLITDGVTRGTSQTDDGYAQDNIHPGDLYFYPRFSAIPNKVKDILFFDPNVKQLYAEARGKPYSSIESDTDIYAKIIAKQHQLLTQLGFDLNCSDDIRHAVIELVSHVKISNPKKTEIDTTHPGYIEAIEFFKKLNKPEAEILAALRTFNEYKGIVFGIHVDVLIENDLQLGDITGQDLKLNLLKTGLSFKHIIGIEPRGKKEYDFFQNLQNKYGGQ